MTGDVRGAGTDANVYIVLFGDNGESGQRFLDNKKNNFERGKKDTFVVESPNLGKIKKIRIGVFQNRNIKDSFKPFYLFFLEKN